MGKKRKTPNTGKVSGAKISSRAARDAINHTLKPVRLSPEITQELLNQLPERAHQARRFIRALANNPDSPTGHLNKGSGVNLSDVSRKYNPFIRPRGYYMACRLPPTPIINGFGEKSGQQLWGIYRVGKSEAQEK